MSVFGNIILMIVLFTSTIVFTIFFYYISGGITTNVVLSRLSKASFKLNPFSIYNLWTAYLIAGLVFVIIYYIFPKLLHIPGSEFVINSYSTTILILFFVFLGRVITKHEGNVQGKFYYSTFLTFGFLLLLIDFFRLGSLSLNDLILAPYIFSESMHDILGFIFLGTLFLSTIGEAWLSVSCSPRRSLSSIAEMFPSDFQEITGLQQCGVDHWRSEVFREHHGAHEKMIQILLSSRNKKIEQVLCCSKSLWMIERVRQIELICGLDLGDNVRVIKLPDSIARERLAKRIIERNPSFDDLRKGRANEINKDWSDYQKRLTILKNYDFLDHDIGDLRFMLTIFENGEKNILFITRDTGPSGTLIGIFSEECYIVEHFQNLFDRIWMENREKIKYRPEATRRIP